MPAPLVDDTAAAARVDIIDVSAGQTHLRTLADVRRLLDGPRIDDARAAAAEPQLHENTAGRRARTLAVRWLIQYSRARREKTMSQRLAHELLDAAQSQGNAFKRKDDIYRMAQANKAFAHYRW